MGVLLPDIARLKLKYVHIEPVFGLEGPPLAAGPIPRRQYLTTRFLDINKPR